MNCHSIPIIKSAINELEKKDCENILYKCIKKKKSSEINTILKKEILKKVKKAKKIIKYEF